MVAIIDYGAGNLMSVKKALDYIGAESEITMDKGKILSASHIILPCRLIRRCNAVYGKPWLGGNRSVCRKVRQAVSGHLPWASAFVC